MQRTSPSNAILGRNGLDRFVRRYNSYEGIKASQDKVYTKGLLMQHDLPVPRMIDLLSYKKDIAKLDWDALPREFVLKPAHGTMGHGIFLLKRAKKGFYRRANKQLLSKWQLFDHIEEILEGFYSRELSGDSVILEERVALHPSFDQSASHGLPDVRVVVFNSMPIMAYLRVPILVETEAKEKKYTNYLLGISLTTGIVTGGYVEGRYTQTLPEGWQYFSVEHWNQILRLAVSTQSIFGLGLLSVDIVLDRFRGPLILEVDAIPPLEAQLANNEPLKSRLDQVAKLRVRSSEEGISLAKEFFGGKQRTYYQVRDENILGITEEVRILSQAGIARKVMAKVDTGADRTSIDVELFKSLGLKTSGKKRLVKSASGVSEREIADVSYYLSGRRIDTAANIIRRKGLKYQVIVGRRDMKGFLVDPRKRSGTSSDTTHLKELDRQLMDLVRGVDVLSHVIPTNVAACKEAFFASGCKETPAFEYPQMVTDLDELKEKLSALRIDVREPLGAILNKRRQETYQLIELLRTLQRSYVKGVLESRGEGGDVNALQAQLFTQASKNYYSRVEAQVVSDAKLALKEVEFGKEVRNIHAPEVLVRFKKELADLGLDGWKVYLSDQMVSDFRIRLDDREIIIREGCRISERELEKAIVHEVYTHVLRRENALMQPYSVFEGTANYLETEEGLAIYNERLARVEKSEKSFLPALYVVAVKKALKYGFVEVFSFLKDMGVSDEYAWVVTLKVKRGLFDVSLPGAFTRDAVYWEGYMRIKEYLKRGGTLEDLYVGKIGLSDIEFTHEMKDLIKPKYLPAFYH